MALLEDVRDAMEGNEQEYFIGSLITIDRGHGASEVVDGQQRLTTLNIVFAQLREHLDDAAAKAEIGKRVLPQDPLTGEQESPRLVLRQRDQKFFRDHVLEARPVSGAAEAALDAPKLRLLDNTRTAADFFADRDQAWLKRFAAYLLRNVYVVLVRTESFQPAFRLFSVLNDRGVGLSNADLIKNQLFGRLPAEQPGLHDDLDALWADLEAAVGVDELDTFLGLYRTAITGRQTREGLAEEFDQLMAASAASSVELLERMLASARNYVRIDGGQVGGGRGPAIPRRAPARDVRRVGTPTARLPRPPRARPRRR